MSTPSLFDWVDSTLSAASSAPASPALPLAPAAVRMAPAAIQARRSGRRAVTSPVTHPNAAMLVYRDALRRIQPATDHEVSAAIRTALDLDGRDHVAWGLSTVNGRRNDWGDLQADCIEAVDRVKVPGCRTSRTRWRIKAGSLADTYEAPR